MDSNNTNKGGALIIFAVSFLMLIVNMDFTVANIAVAAIAENFNSSLSTVKWVITGYALTTGLFMTIGGRLGDIFGLKLIYILGVIIFILCSFICGIAPNIEILILARFFQGIGTALSFPICFAFIAVSFNDSKRALALGIGNAIAGFTLAIGPTLGGLILTYLSWRWIFYINIPIGIIALIMAYVFVDVPKNKSQVPLDFISIFVYVSSLFLILFALNMVDVWHFSSPLFIFSTILGAILFIVFVVMQHKRKFPLLDIELLTHFKYLLANTIRFILQYIFFGLLIVCSIYFQNILDYGSLMTGVLLLIMTLVYGVTAPIAGIILPIVGARILLVVSMIVMGIGCMIFAYNSLIPSFTQLAIPLILFGLGCGVISTVTETEALGCFDIDKAGVAAGLFFTIVALSGVVGAAISSMNLISISDQNLFQLLKQNNLLSYYSTILSHAAEGSYSIKLLANHFDPNIAPLVQKIASQSFRCSFNFVMWVYFGLCCLGIVLSIILPKKNNHCVTTK